MRPTLYTDVTVAETIMPVGGVERVWEVHSTIDNLDGLCGNSDLVREVGGGSLTDLDCTGNLAPVCFRVVLAEQHGSAGQ